LGPAIDALREAPNHEKAEFLKRLKSVSCEETELCALRSLCLAAYQQHVNALATIGRVKEQLPATRSRGLETALSAARKELLEAGKRTHECAQRRANFAEALGN
jgi:hypothetical protein